MSEKQTYDNIFDYINNNPNYYCEKIIPLIDLVETYQGEGPNCGKKMLLARFKYCNKLCPFCDTQVLMNNMSTTMYSLSDMGVMLKKSPNLMITGGEPTIKVKAGKQKFSQLDYTCYILANLDYEFVDIETNGCNMLDLRNWIQSNMEYGSHDFNISWSPKFIKNGDFQENIDILKELISIELSTKEKINVTPIIKIVIGDDLDQYKDFIYQAILKYGFNNNRVYLMPKGVSIEEINKSMEMVLKVAGDLSCNVSSRLHIIHNFK